MDNEVWLEAIVTVGIVNSSVIVEFAAKRVTAPKSSPRHPKFGVMVQSPSAGVQKRSALM